MKLARLNKAGKYLGKNLPPGQKKIRKMEYGIG